MILEKSVQARFLVPMSLLGLDPLGNRHYPVHRPLVLPHSR